MAAKLAKETMQERIEKETKLRDYLIQKIEDTIPYAKLNGSRTTRLPNNVNFCFRFSSNGALRALYDNCGENEATALKLHKAIVKARLDGFRNNPVKANKIKRALYQLLNDDSEVERIYQIVVEQEEY